MSGTTTDLSIDFDLTFPDFNPVLEAPFDLRILLPSLKFSLLVSLTTTENLFMLGLSGGRDSNNKRQLHHTRPRKTPS